MLQSLTYNAGLLGVETLTFGDGSTANVTHAAVSQQQNLKADTVPPVTNMALVTATLPAGPLTIDLTALTDGTGAAIAYAGKRVQFCKLVNGNANSVAVTGNYGLAFTVPAKSEVLLGAQALGAIGIGQVIVASTANTIILTGTGSQSFAVAIVVG